MVRRSLAHTHPSQSTSEVTRGTTPWPSLFSSGFRVSCIATRSSLCDFDGNISAEMVVRPYFNEQKQVLPFDKVIELEKIDDWTFRSIVKAYSPTGT